MYKAKATGKDGYALFESAMHTVAQDRIQLDMDLANALGAEQFFLVYQPMLNLESERVVGVEALLRWLHPTRGVIPPDVFIPIAEENGLIVSIGRWVLEQACAQAASWHHKGYRLDISVNVSARQLERPQFVEEVRTALQNSGLDATTLTLEITETALMRKPDATTRLLTELKALGVRIAIDDFGTGYSSLAYLRRFPVDTVKIDGSYVENLADSPENQVFVRTLVGLAKNLGLKTVAEWVGSDADAGLLQSFGVDYFQGFHFGEPLLDPVWSKS